MKQENDKVQVVIRAVNLVVCVAFLVISIWRVNMNQWSSSWIWIWGLLTLLNIIFLFIKAKDLKKEE